LAKVIVFGALLRLVEDGLAVWRRNAGHKLELQRWSHASRTRSTGAGWVNSRPVRRRRNSGLSLAVRRERPAATRGRARRRVARPAVARSTRRSICWDRSRSRLPVRTRRPGATFAAIIILRGLPGGEEWMVAGHYIFELTKTADRWKVRKMRLETLHQSGNSGLLQGAAVRPGRA
jgi:hypothetical protein